MAWAVGLAKSISYAGYGSLQFKSHLSHSKDESPEDHEMHEEQNLTEATSMIQNDEGFMNNQVQNDSLPIVATPTSTIIERESINQIPVKSDPKQNEENPPGGVVKNLKRNLRSEMQTSKSRHYIYAIFLIILSVILWQSSHFL